MRNPNFLLALPTLLAMVACVGIGIYAWRQKSPGARPFALMMLAAGEWALCSAAGFAGASAEAAEFWSSAQYVGLVTVPAAWLTFALQYGGQTRWLNWRVNAALCVMPLLTLALVATNASHGLIAPDLDSMPGGASAADEPGLWYWIVDGYSYLLLALGALVLVPLYRRSEALYRRQIAVMVAGALLPWALDVLADLDVLPTLRGMDMTSFGFVFTGLVFSWGLFRFQLLDLAPVARDAIIDSLGDGVIVLDRQNRIVDLNPAARALLAPGAPAPIGQLLAAAWPPVCSLVEAPATAADGARSEVAVPDGSGAAVYDVQIRPWSHAGAVAGRLVTVHNISARKLAEQAMERRNTELAALNRLGQSLSQLAEAKSLLGLIHATVGQIVDNRNLYIALYDDSTQSISFPLYVVNGERIRREARPMARGMTEHIIRTGVPLCLLHDLSAEAARLGIERQHHPAACYLGVPMRLGERVAGVLAVQDYERENAFDSGHADLLATIASQAAVALENARLFAETRRRADQLQAINDIERALAQFTDPEQLAEQIMRVVSTQLGIRHVGIGLIDGDVLAFQWLDDRAGGPQALKTGLRIPLDHNSITGQAFTRGETVLVPDTAADSRFELFDDWPLTRSEIAVPLRTQSGIIGVINVESDELNDFPPETAALLETVAGQIAIAVENARLFAEMERMAVTDALTGVANRRRLFDIGERAIGDARRSGRPLAALMVDIDHFKQVNDRHGHAVGDHILRSVAHACQQQIRANDVIARYGGEEFALLLVNTDDAGAVCLAERLRTCVAGLVTETPAGPLRVTISVGVSAIRPDGGLAESLDRADQALYAAKQAGRNRVMTQPEQDRPRQ